MDENTHMYIYKVTYIYVINDICIYIYIHIPTTCAMSQLFSDSQEIKRIGETKGKMREKLHINQENIADGQNIVSSL